MRELGPGRADDELRGATIAEADGLEAVHVAGQHHRQVRRQPDREGLGQRRLLADVDEAVGFAGGGPALDLLHHAPDRPMGDQPARPALAQDRGNPTIVLGIGLDVVEERIAGIGRIDRDDIEFTQLEAHGR